MKLRSSAVIMALFLAAASAGEEPEWTYEGSTGPLKWGS